MPETLSWKPDWLEAKARLIDWWNGRGMAIALIAERNSPIEIIPQPVEPGNIEDWWTDPFYRLRKSEAYMASHAYLAEAFPYFDTQIGPGSLGIILGAKPGFDRETVWYEPCIDDRTFSKPVRFDPQMNPWFTKHMELIELGMQSAHGRYLVGIPDLIENLDTLAALRGSEQLLYDLIERPSWVQDRLAEINVAYSTVFERMFACVQDDDGGNAFAAFSIWGPGKTAKLQCDFSAMLSPKMFHEFAVPYLSDQCRWLDFSLYHLDGTTALQHLDGLLEIEPLKAIEWTPQAGLPGGGSPQWYVLYQRIKAGSKSVEAVGVEVHEVIPLLDAVGPEGMLLILANPVPERTAEELLKALEPYRS